MNRESLLQLFERHQGKVADKWQLYLEEYERLLAPYRDRPVRVLEIGVQNGGTLEIWAKYFPQAKVLIGCDIDPACAELEFDDPRINVIIGDVNNDRTQAEISAASIEFDIIVDDGSHRSGDIIRSFGLLFPKLALGGSYVIEDLHCSYWDVYEGGLYYPFSSIAFLKSLADTLNHNHWGLEKSIDAILEGFRTVHQVAIDKQSLRLIHSVEFTDSVCTIRKLSRSKNVLGKRMVSGKFASVFPVEELGSQMVEDSIVPSQQGNHWSNGNYPSADGL
ncbi:MAG: class I SAM-dependent methyltransferase, partial [Xanthomonadales bacterium]|nr:class I SAM-dependent methyltransferase [Xanthomonadales bacterium]